MFGLRPPWPSIGMSTWGPTVWRVALIDVDPMPPIQTLLKRIGGRKVVERFVDHLYDRIQADDSLYSMIVRDLGGN